MTVQTFLDGRVTLHCSDCLDVLATLPESSVDSVVCDPPYHLVSIVKRFGAKNAAKAKVGKTGAYARASAGFMGKQWDGGDIAFRVELWAQVLRVLKPGGHLLAFSGTRTYHRMVCAIEDAGFDVRDQIGWAYGSGFPKSHNAGGGWGSALKPAWEPIVLARKQLIGTIAENVAEYGTGAINIDGCRVDTADNLSGGAYTGSQRHDGTKNWRYKNGGAGRSPLPGDEREGAALGMFQLGKIVDKEFVQPIGRWPANIVHDGSEEVLAAFPDSDGQQGYVGPEQGDRPSRGIYGDFGARPPNPPRGDSGSAARFFACFPQQNEARCDLCNLLSESTFDSIAQCNANNVDEHSGIASTRNGASAPSSAADCSPPASGGRNRKRSSSAATAATVSSPSCPITDSSAPQPALTLDESRIARNVESAASLCGSCATAIAQSLAATLRGQSPEAALSPVSISEHSKRILSRSLALHVAGRENTDITTTTESLRTLLGCVLPAIAATTKSERSESTASTNSDRRRLHYTSKADAEDRLGSKHPTVKPLDLMQWLVRLVTPKGGTVLDPFAGTGTTGEAAWREGMNAILIEREEEYQADIARRMDLATNPTKRSAVAATKNNLDDPNSLPLFAGDVA